MFSLILFILILSFLVLIHEFGHFIAAKKNGIKVEEFAIGFPPRLFAIKKGETTYTINIFPLGGFVRLFGEEYQGLSDEPTDKDRAFAFKKPYQKALVVAAGVCMNIAFGVIILYGIIASNGFISDPLPLLFPHHFTFGVQQGRVIATNLAKGSPAEKAGIKPEDIISSYSIDSDSAIVRLSSAQQLIDMIKKSPGKKVYLETVNLKNGTTKTVPVVPQYNATLKRAIIGVSLIDGIVISYEKPVDKLFSGFMHSYNVLEYNFSAIGKLIGMAIKEKSTAPVSGAVAGPVGIYGVVNDMVQTSGAQLVKNILNLMALLSLSLGVMNILPFPALDGGRMVFVVYEWITGKQVNKKVENITNIAGFVFLMGVALLVSISDILKLLK
ncbi:MAG: M50 family metallopeptidase [Candidatus Roizmanbacteria bacterium]|nr:M50 family metallopeptidase [Candidatus Roizmanbacteria bacterium]